MFPFGALPLRTSPPAVRSPHHPWPHVDGSQSSWAQSLDDPSPGAWHVNDKGFRGLWPHHLCKSSPILGTSMQLKLHMLWWQASSADSIWILAPQNPRAYDRVLFYSTKPGVVYWAVIITGPHTNFLLSFIITGLHYFFQAEEMSATEEVWLPTTLLAFLGFRKSISKWLAYNFWIKLSNEAVLLFNKFLYVKLYLLYTRCLHVVNSTII